jgi:hypothetical protein
VNHVIEAAMGHHHHHSHGSASQIDRIVGPLCGGGIPFVLGIIFAPIGIHHLAQGDPNMEPLGWVFTILGVFLAFCGAVTVMVLWPERKTPARDDRDDAWP